MPTTSTSLLIRLREPTDQAAWSRFVNLYGPLIYHWAKRTGLKEEDASDLVQDVMALLIRKLPAFEYDKSRSFRSWLKTVTLNKWRETCRRKSIPTHEASLSGLCNIPEKQADEFWDADYRKYVVSRAMDLMKQDFQPKTWQACRRYVLGEAKPDELAAEYGISVWTIYSAKSRLIKRLREELDGMLD